MTDQKQPSKSRKILNIVFNVLIYVFFAVCVLALVLSIASKRDADGAISVFGIQMRIVVSDSMGKCEQTDVSEYEIGSIPIRSMIFTQSVPTDPAAADAWYAELEKGDVLTFRYLYVTQETITHRIKDITPKETGGYIIELEGDNKASDTNTLTQTIDTSLSDSPNYVIGKVTGQSYLLGLLVSMIKQPIGIICIVIIPSVIIAIFEIFRIINALTEGKREREREAQQKRDDEFEAMKRQLEQLQRQAQAAELARTTAEASARDDEKAEISPESEQLETVAEIAEEAEEETEEQL